MFLTVHMYLHLKVDSFCTVYSPDNNKFRSVGISKPSYVVLKTKAYVNEFLTMCDNSVMAYLENF